MPEYKLFNVYGIRHSEVVLAETSDEALRLAIDAYKKRQDNKDNELDPRVLHKFGVGDWEDPSVKEIELPRGYRIIKE